MLEEKISFTIILYDVLQGLKKNMYFQACSQAQHEVIFLYSCQSICQVIFSPTHNLQFVLGHIRSTSISTKYLYKSEMVEPLRLEQHSSQFF